MEKNYNVEIIAKIKTKKMIVRGEDVEDAINKVLDLINKNELYDLEYVDAIVSDYEGEL